MEEIESQDTSDGKLPFYQEYLLDSLANKRPFSNTLKNYLWFLDLQVRLYIIEFKKRHIRPTFSEFLSSQKKDNLQHMRNISFQLKDIEKENALKEWEDSDEENEGEE